MADRARAGAPPRWMTRRPELLRFAMALGAGALAALGHAPFGQTVVALVGFVTLLALIATAPAWRRAFAAGWAAGTAYFAVALHWIVEPFQVDAALHGWMAPFALVLLSGGLALFWGGAAAVAAVVARSGAARIAALVAALALAELARAYVFTGFPWAIPAYIWADLPQRGWVVLAGSHGLTFLTLALAGLAAGMGLATGGRIRWKRAVMLAVSVTVFLFAGPALLPPPAAPGAERPVIRLVQPNAPQHEKWDPNKIEGFYRRQLASTAAPADRRPDLVVWPETAIPWLLHRAGPALEQIAEAAGGSPVVLGVQRRDEAGFRNSLAVIGPDGVPVATYDKHHLVPFGEYMPFPALFRATGIRGLAERADGGYVPGPGAKLIDLGPIGRALPLICYEAIFPQDVLAAPDRPDFLLQLTNDAWFGEFSGPYQHLAQARMRAVETNLPMVRAANTGVSAMIDPGGRILAEIPLGQAGYIDVALPEPGPPTLYARTGDGPVLVLLLALLGGLAVVDRRNRH